MPLIKFIGYTGVLLLLDSIVLAPFALLVTFVVKLATKTGLGDNSTEKILHWLVFGTKTITLWFVATLLVLGANYYSIGNSIYFWASIIIGALLLYFAKLNTILNCQKSVYDAAMRRWGNSDLAMAEVRTGSMPRLWKHEGILYFLALVYILIAALFNSLVEFAWLKTVFNGILWIFTVQIVFSFVVYLIGWVVVGRYLFVICMALGMLPKEISGKSNKSDLAK